MSSGVLITTSDTVQTTTSPVNSLTPSYIGQYCMYKHDNITDIYIAKGTSSADWMLLYNNLSTTSHSTQTELNSLKSKINTGITNLRELQGAASSDITATKNKDYVYVSNNVQMHRVTQNDGAVLVISGTDLNSTVKTGFYNGQNLTNAPGTGWYYIQVMSHGDTNYCLQIATSLSDTTGIYKYQRRRHAGTWSEWELTDRKITVSQNDPSGWKNGDIWFRV